MKNIDRLGVMIDCSRNAVPNLEYLKKFLSIISKMGYNMAMLYTEDTFEVENEPYFGYMRGRYSIDEIKEIDEYAASVGIELIPCVQTLAHLNCIFRWREYNRNVRDIDDILLIDDERTYTLIENIFASLRKSYKTNKVHIGMDEAHHVGLGKYLDRHGFCDRYELILKHLNKVCEIAKKYGFEPIMWGDMFFRLATGEYFADKKVDFSSEIKEKIPENCELVYWDYCAAHKERYDAMFSSFADLSDKIWFAGGAWVWGGFAPHNRYSIKRNAVAIEKSLEHGVKNILLTLWGDNGGECPYIAALPTLMHTAALIFGYGDDEMKQRFFDITGEYYDDMLLLDVPDCIKGENLPLESPYGQNFPCNYAKTLLYDDILMQTMNTDFSDNDFSIYLSHAKRLRSFAAKNTPLAFLYNSYAYLCDALAIKLPLLAATRRLYKENNKQALLLLAENQYNECISALEKFHKAFRNVWYTVNKTYGFEIQDIRLGGLIKRIESAKDRIISYATGEIDKIDELCEEILPIRSECMHKWEEIVSSCII